jgi:hypothetical protein
VRGERQCKPGELVSKELELKLARLAKEYLIAANHLMKLRQCRILQPPSQPRKETCNLTLHSYDFNGTRDPLRLAPV